MLAFEIWEEVLPAEQGQAMDNRMRVNEKQ